MSDSLGQLIEFVTALREQGVVFRLECWREAIMVVIPGPDKYKEVEFFADGHVEVQSFGPSSHVMVIPYEEMRDQVLRETM